MVDEDDEGCGEIKQDKAERRRQKRQLRPEVRGIRHREVYDDTGDADAGRHCGRSSFS